MSAPTDPPPTPLELARQLMLSLSDRRRLLPLVVKIIEELEPCRHGPGFASVNWHGREFGFSGARAKIVECLWQAWENGTPDVRQEYLLDVAGSDLGGDESRGPARLADLFKNHDAWGTLIVGGKSKGTFRLHNGPIQ